MKMWLLIAGLMMTFCLAAQDVKTLLKEAENLERSLKADTEAIEKYKQVLAVDPGNVMALVRASELSSAVGSRVADKKARRPIYEQAKDFADRAIAADAANADAHYVRGLAAGKLAEIETENKKMLAYMKEMKDHAEKAISINAQHGRATYLLGKWHFEMVTMPWAKKAAAKVLFGGIPGSTIEDATRLMEQSRTFDKYYVRNYLELAKAYKYDNKPGKTLDILNILLKLPNRTSDDAALKEEGRKMLNEMM